MPTTNELSLKILYPLVLFFVSLDLGLIGYGVYLFITRPQQRQQTLVWTGSAVALLGLLLVFATRLSLVWFGYLIVQVDLFDIIFSSPSSFIDIALVLLASLVVWISRRARWGKWLTAAVAFGLVAWQLGFGLTDRTELLATPALAGIVFCGLVFWLAYRNPGRVAIALLAPAVVLVALVLGSRNDPDFAALHLADGLAPNFKVNLYTLLPEMPTAMNVDPDNNLYVATADGSVFLLEDRDGDGVAELTHTFVDSLGQALGVVWHDGKIYISANTPGTKDSGKVLVAEDSDGDGVADQLNTILEGLPTGHSPAHQTNGLALGPDNRLYLGIGSTSDHNIEKMPLAATIISFNLDGSDLRVFATGLRNAYGLAFAPDGRLFATDNGPSELNDLLAYVPPDELNFVVEGGDYGFPNFYGEPPAETGTLGALATLTMQTVPTGLTVYSGSMFPPEYQNNIFVALWQKGPRMHDGLPQRGLRIARFVLTQSNGQWQAEDHDFLLGLQKPIDVKVGHHGELYVADMFPRRIYRVTYSP